MKKSERNKNPYRFSGTHSVTWNPHMLQCGFCTHICMSTGFVDTGPGWTSQTCAIPMCHPKGEGRGRGRGRGSSLMPPLMYFCTCCLAHAISCPPSPMLSLTGALSCLMPSCPCHLTLLLLLSHCTLACTILLPPSLAHPQPCHPSPASCCLTCAILLLLSCYCHLLHAVTCAVPLPTSHHLLQAPLHCVTHTVSLPLSHCTLTHTVSCPHGAVLVKNPFHM